MRFFMSLVLLAACSQPAPKDDPAPAPQLPDAKNPTGDCPPPDNGARAGHAPSNSRWLPDCTLPLKQEYFRVFALSTRTAYMMPRPDYVATTQIVCKEEAAGSPVRAMFDRYTLCDATPDVAKINAMAIDDAFVIARALHARLRFVAGPGGASPHPQTSDIVVICKTQPQLAHGALKSLCAWELPRDAQRQAGQGVTEEARMPDESEGPPLAKALNALYGIADE
jgi:hypothetical protein